MTDSTERPRLPVKALIREARALSVYEKALLFIIESHSKGQMFVSAQKAADHMGGVALRTFYNTRASLLVKGLIEVEERPRTTSVYRINARALHLLLDPASGLAGAAHLDAPETSPSAPPASPVLHEALGEGEQEERTIKVNTQTSPPPPEGVGAGECSLDFDFLAKEIIDANTIDVVDASATSDSAVPEPSRIRPEKSNQFAGYCAECNRRVRPGQGLLGGRKPDNTFEVVHRDGDCPARPGAAIQPEAEKDPPKPHNPAEEAAPREMLQLLKDKVTGLITETGLARLDELRAEEATTRLSRQSATG